MRGIQNSEGVSDQEEARFSDTLQDAKGHATDKSVVQWFSQIEGVDFIIWDKDIVGLHKRHGAGRRSEAPSLIQRWAVRWHFH
jgi:hypothetical protein